MEALAAGQIVVLPFPFSDLSRSKYRPALLLADAGRGDWIACQVTSNPYADPRAIEILDTDFLVGGLQRTSYARPGKLFTASLLRRRRRLSRTSSWKLGTRLSPSCRKGGRRKRIECFPS